MGFGLLWTYLGDLLKWSGGPKLRDGKQTEITKILEGFDFMKSLRLD
jgi:hypothetical protein